MLDEARHTTEDAKLRARATAQVQADLTADPRLLGDRLEGRHTEDGERREEDGEPSGGGKPVHRERYGGRLAEWSRRHRSLLDVRHVSWV